MCAGSIFYTFAIGNIVNVISNLSTKEKIINEKIEIINDFCRETKVSKELREKLKNAIIFFSNKNLFTYDRQKVF